MSDIQPKPDDVDLPDDKVWDELSPYQRYYYKNREEEIKRTQSRKEELNEWFKGYKEGLSCEECGESRSPCLVFHHEDEDDKSFNVSEMVAEGYGRETIKQEIDKCTVLCANCHRVGHATERFI
jgi:hypothetical protein